MLGIIRVGMTSLRGCHLVGHAGHRPALRGVVGMVVCEYLHVAAGYVRSGYVIDYLLVVSGQRIVYGLRHTWYDSGSVGGKHGVVRVLGLRSGGRIRVDRVDLDQHILAVFIAPVGKDIAARGAEQPYILKLREAA